MRAAKILLVLLMLAPAVVAAQQDDHSGPYAEFRGGGILVPSVDMELSGEPGKQTADFDAGFAVSGALGYRFTRNVRAEGELSYRQAEIGDLSFPSVGSLNGQWNLGAFTAMANVIYDIDYRDLPVVPYVGAGIGFGLVRLDGEHTAPLRVDDDSPELAWNAMAGVRFRVIGNALVSVGYRYLATTDPAFARTEGRIATEFATHEIFGGIGYEF
ncbi:MAG TPA: porin family protein [Myxococcota bacterium]